MLDVDPRLPAVASAVADVLATGLRSLVLHGSAVHGGLRPHSDLDLLAIVDSTLEHPAREALTAALLRLSGRRATAGPGRPVELSVVVAAAVRPWRHPAVCDYQYGEWLRDEYERGVVPAPRVDPDLAVLLSAARATGRTLLGEPAASLLDPVPVDDLRAAGEGSVPGLLAELQDDTANVLLTLARIAATHELGRILPKDEAAAWALPRMPPDLVRPVADARAVHLGERPDVWRVDVVVRRAADALAELAR